MSEIVDKVYFGDWEEPKGKSWGGKALLEEDFRHILRDNEKILFAWYSYEDYEAAAFVLFEKEGKYYEVHGSHCSCYGLEDQWEPEECDLAVLREQAANYKQYSWSGMPRQALIEAINNIDNKKS